MTTDIDDNEDVPNMARDPELMRKYSPDRTHTQAMTDVIRERFRQIETEGWTPEHDDQHDDGAIAMAAAAYAVLAEAELEVERGGIAAGFVKERTARAEKLWPWDWSWWKPKGSRRDLVRAGALIIAEIERLDRVQVMADRAKRGEGQ